MRTGGASGGADFCDLLPRQYDVADHDGAFTIRGLPSGEYEIEVAHPGMNPAHGRVTVKEGEPAKLDLEMPGPVPSPSPSPMPLPSASSSAAPAPAPSASTR